MDGQYSTVGGAVAMNAKRGYVPEDDRNFSPEAVSTLKTTSRHVVYLIFWTTAQAG